MPVIKRYPNRKLYDTAAKQYITLDGIAALIRQGEPVQVVDHASGEDLTTLTLTQVILEQEKKRCGLLPQSVLTGLIQAGEERLHALRQALASPRDLARQVDEEIERRVQELTSRGELALEEGRSLRDKLLGQALGPAGASQPTDADIERLLHAHGVPTREDLEPLFAQLELLAARLGESRSDTGTD